MVEMMAGEDAALQLPAQESTSSHNLKYRRGAAGINIFYTQIVWHNPFDISSIGTGCLICLKSGHIGEFNRIIACDSLIWLSVVWVSMPRWSEVAREEWEGQSSVSSKEAWTCHPLSKPLILPPELLPSEERNKYRFLHCLPSSGFDLQSDPIFGTQIFWYSYYRCTSEMKN